MEFYKNLSGADWASLLPFGVACAAVGFGVKTLCDKKCCWNPCQRQHPQSDAQDVVDHPVNVSIKKAESKVVDTIDIEDMGNKASFCRCWRSAKFPYCDGSHNAHNKATGDNVGPLCFKKKDS